VFGYYQWLVQYKKQGEQVGYHRHAAKGA